MHPERARCSPHIAPAGPPPTIAISRIEQPRRKGQSLARSPALVTWFHHDGGNAAAVNHAASIAENIAAAATGPARPCNKLESILCHSAGGIRNQQVMHGSKFRKAHHAGHGDSQKATQTSSFLFAPSDPLLHYEALSAL